MEQTDPPANKPSENPFVKKQLVFLSEDKSNAIVTFAEIKSLKEHTNYQLSQIGAYYPYDTKIEDRGWGCAWRAIQTFLSCHGQKQDFDQLFNRFNQKEVLINVIQAHKMYDQKICEQLVNLKWAPGQISSGWAEPFICHLISRAFGIQTKLILLNSYPEANAPASVFQRTINFNEFKLLVKNKLNQGSLMIDDGCFALSIIGLKEEGQDFTLLFGDPHISSNKDCLLAGIYSNSYTAEGKIKQIFQSEEQKKYALYKVVDQLDFESKGWMICYKQK